LIKNLVMF